MKYVNLTNTSKSLHQILTSHYQRKEQFSEEDVAGKFDNEILEWVEDGWMIMSLNMTGI
jgi:hypothetical protein